MALVACLESRSRAEGLCRRFAPCGAGSAAVALLAGVVCQALSALQQLLDWLWEARAVLFSIFDSNKPLIDGGMTHGDKRSPSLVSRSMFSWSTARMRGFCPSWCR